MNSFTVTLLTLTVLGSLLTGLLLLLKPLIALSGQQGFLLLHLAVGTRSSVSSFRSDAVTAGSAVW